MPWMAIGVIGRLSVAKCPLELAKCFEAVDQFRDCSVLKIKQDLFIQII